jgi:hypothetical protein
MLKSVKKIRMPFEPILKRRFKTSFKLVEIVDDGVNNYFLFTRQGTPYDSTEEQDKAFFELKGHEVIELCRRVAYEKGMKRRKLKGLAIDLTTFEMVFVIVNA